MRLRIGELFAGYGGLGMGVQQVYGGDVIWYSDVCKFNKDGSVGHYDPHRGACRILKHRLPGVPNLGDVSAVDWSQVEPVDILTGGSPCQDLSHAGRRTHLRQHVRWRRPARGRRARMSNRLYGCCIDCGLACRGDRCMDYRAHRRGVVIERPETAALPDGRWVPNGRGSVVWRSLATGLPYRRGDAA